MDNQLYNLDSLLTNSQKEIHIRIQQRTGRKRLTSIEGLDKFCTDNNGGDNDSNELKNKLTELSRKLKKQFNCGVTIIDMEPGYIMQLNGDHRKELKEYLVKNNIAQDNQIKIHGI